VIRVVCPNAESDLATLIAPHTGRPREAKKVIANVLAAPGRVTVTDQAIHVRLAPAAHRSERVAIGHLFTAINKRGLVLPSDPSGFHSALSSNPCESPVVNPGARRAISAVRRAM